MQGDQSGGSSGLSRQRGSEVVEHLPYPCLSVRALVARPDLMRLRLWKLLERPTATGPEAEAFGHKTAEVADAQQRGDLAREMEPADLLTMVVAAAQAWFWAAEGVDPKEAGQSWSAQRLALHRAAVVEAARRISEPRTAGE
ncbi:hypothetical protein [Streptomyces sp. NPDC001250]|uniref:hypothetical protein n=1 Tax=unclassified Streptomyces TaxID=2593676 RepID=UPI00331E6224